MTEDRDATNQLYPALLAALREMGPVRKEARGNFGRYANLDTVLDAVTDPLHNHGIILTQTFDSNHDGTPVLVTRLIHAASGDTLGGSVPVVAKDMQDPQKVGAAITYYRRYSILAILGLTAEDDDGQSAAQPATPPRPAPSGGDVTATRSGWKMVAPARTPTVTQEAYPAGASAPAQPETGETAARATWTDVWSLARTQGITDKVALAQACAVQSAASLSPDEIIKRLRQREVR